MLPMLPHDKANHVAYGAALSRAVGTVAGAVPAVVVSLLA